MIEEILKHNKKFVEDGSYNKYLTDKYPQKKIAILSCMDTRLVELLPEALGIKNGDAMLIKNAGGSIAHPFGSVVRSLIIAIYNLGVEEIMVVGHTDCGVQHMECDELIEKMKENGVSEDQLNLMKYSGVDFESWLGGFDNVEESVFGSVNLIKKHPLIPKHISIRGFVMDSTTGALEELK
ncbi:MAG: beta-class carbonic anhydrase [Proteocatella sp.]